jgi:hypothetical protein
VYRQGDADSMARAEAIVQAHVAAQPALMAIPACRASGCTRFSLAHEFGHLVIWSSGHWRQPIPVTRWLMIKAPSPPLDGNGHSHRFPRSTPRSRPVLIPRKVGDQMTQFTIATWNVNGIRARQGTAARMDGACAAGCHLSSGD